MPKTYLPNYGEFYEKRQFTPGSTEVETITVCGQQVSFGDVYKRQPQACAGLMASSTRKPTIRPMRMHSRACLLYTSRCV